MLCMYVRPLSSFLLKWSHTSIPSPATLTASVSTRRSLSLTAHLRLTALCGPAVPQDVAIFAVLCEALTTGTVGCPPTPPPQKRPFDN